RAAIVLASAAEGLQPPLDAPWLRIQDLDGLRTFAQRARDDGFGGMLLIHPSHVETVNQVFSPTADEVTWARGIVASAGEAEAAGRGAYARDGQMVDEAVVRRARRILHEAQRCWSSASAISRNAIAKGSRSSVRNSRIPTGA